MLFVGLAIMALGVSFSIKADLGTSPISSLPYATSVVSGLSVGVTTAIMHGVLILIQIAILRRDYDPFQLLQIPTSLFFSAAIDVAGLALQGVTHASYLQQWGLCIVGILLVGVGVALEVASGTVTVPGEGTVLAICKKAPIKFSTMKICFDLTLVVLAVITGLVFVGALVGVREGTLAAALCVGLVARQAQRPIRWLQNRCFVSERVMHEAPATDLRAGK